MSPGKFIVRSLNFDWHEPIGRATYEEALAAAKQRGFQANISRDGELVASWCPLYGARVYDNRLTQ